LEDIHKVVGGDSDGGWRRFKRRLEEIQKEVGGDSEGGWRRFRRRLEEIQKEVGGDSEGGWRRFRRRLEEIAGIFQLQLHTVSVQNSSQLSSKFPFDFSLSFFSLIHAQRQTKHRTAINH
jgi:hypothetical protein